MPFVLFFPVYRGQGLPAARQRDSETEKNGSELGRKRSDCWAIHKQ